MIRGLSFVVTEGARKLGSLDSLYDTKKIEETSYMGQLWNGGYDLKLVPKMWYIM